MKPRIHLARWATVAGLALTALPAVNCYFSGDNIYYYCPICHEFVPVFKSKAAGPGNHVVEIVGGKHGDGSTDRSQRRLYPPFRVEGTIGLFDPKHADIGTAGFGFSVIEDNLGSGFAGATLNRSGAGVQITPDVGGTQTTTLSVPTALQATVAIVHDGTNLIVLARGPGDADFTELARGPGPVDTYQPSLDSDTLPPGARIGYDDMHVVYVGRQPGLSPIDSLREDVYLAADAVLLALPLADGPTPDAAGAATQLADARDKLDTAIAEAQADGASKKARSQLAAARKKVVSALATVQGKKPASKYFAAVEAAGKAIGTSTKSIQ